VDVPDGTHLPAKDQLQAILLERNLAPFLDEVRKERFRETRVVESHVETSLNTILNRENCTLAELVTQRESGSEESGLEGRIKQAENRIDEIHQRLEHRRNELARQRECAVTDIRHVGRAWVLPHPDRDTPTGRAMRRDEDVERAAIEVATRALEAEGFVVESVESENRGFDLVARKPAETDLQNASSVRFVEVKGRAETGEVALTTNEFKTAERLKRDYWLYIVFNCSSPSPSLNILRDPARLHWQPIVKIEHYRLKLEDQRNPHIKEDETPFGEKPA